MSNKRKKCIDPSAGSKIPLEITFPIAAGKVPFPSDLHKEPDFSPESRHHLEQCESCRNDLRDNLSLWYKKGMSAYRSNLAYEIVNASEGGDPTILRRSTASGVALFKPGEDRTKGLFVLVTPEHYIHDPEEKTLEEFNHLS
jgi:hypothetical protein